MDVIKTEEKGSDVNLATLLLVDAFRGDFEQAVLITNDSDLALPVETVRADFQAPVGIIYPCSRPGRTPSSRLRTAATFTRQIRDQTLARCQFPAMLSDTHGTFRRPATW